MALIKTKTVLDNVEGNIYVQMGDGIDPSRAHLMELDPNVAADLEHPQKITITIEPGDKLNA